VELFQEIIFHSPQIFTRARHWLRRASAHHNPGPRLPKTFQGWTLEIGLKIPHMCAYNFGGSGRNLSKFYHIWGDNVDINFARGHRTKFQRNKISDNKKSPKFSAIFNNYLRKGSTYRKSEKYLINHISSATGWKNLVNCDLPNQKVIGAHTTGVFQETIFRPLGRWPLKFSYALVAPWVVFPVGLVAPGGLKLGSAPCF